MNTEAAVRAAKNPQEAMLALATSLDALRELVTHLNVPTDELALEWTPDQAEQRTRITTTDDSADIEIPPPNEERLEQRRIFEQQQLRLGEHLGTSEDWTEAYAKGGPMWLYLGNRDLVMSYPESIRAAMVEDVIATSPLDAEEMGRDVLKQAGEDGPGSVAMAANDQIVNMP